jgi:hypothetical protein
MASVGRGEQAGNVECQECRRVGDDAWRGWRAYHGDVSDESPAPLLVFYCPDCAEREFGPLRAPSDA